MQEPGTRIPFVENKPLDLVQIGQILQLSHRASQWANFGPVSKLLERFIGAHLNIPDDRAVVMCASGTAALNAIAAAHAMEAGRHLRWAVSSYGFLCTNTGPFADAIVLDCDDEGLLSLDLLKALEPDTCDGVVVTNTFGLHPGLQKHLALCREKKLRVVVDNAAALHGYDREGSPVDEFASFHQTKPWGMGEGGCAIVSRALEPLVRSFLNFGVGLSSFPRDLAANGKISDLACAAIFSRLITQGEWALLYRSQARRIAEIGVASGFELLGHPDFGATIPAHVALLAPIEIPRTALENPWCALQKYYKPLAATENARRIYARVLNVPCHPGMKTLADSHITAMLQTVLRNATRAKDHSTTTAEVSIAQCSENQATCSSTRSG
ncbi:MAG: DegT/DnrJ/EryC1/StrS family aminotransferase [Terriglobia bacterium]